MKSKSKKIDEALDSAYALSTWAAAINWSEQETNTTEWLLGLKARIEDFQSKYLLIRDKPSSGTIDRVISLDSPHHKDCDCMSCLPHTY